MNVLVVDDDVVSRMVLMHLVDGCGAFDIAEAEDGEDAWSQLAAGLRPAICFCDLRMPRLSGMGLLGRIKADPALAAIPFVLVSSATDGATVAQALALGASGYLVKPFDGAQVRVQLAGLDGARGGAAHAEAPGATLARLGISAERLLIYLGGLQGQLTAASAEIGALPASEQPAAVRARLERLHAGCLTLGLTGAAAALSGAAVQADAIQTALADAVRAVVVQSDAVKKATAAAGPNAASTPGSNPATGQKP